MKSLKLSRRKFIKASGATVATVALSNYLIDWSGQPLLGEAMAQEAMTDKWLPTTCWIGKQECGMMAHVVDGRIVKFEGHPDHPRNRGTLCPKGIAQIAQIYDPYRIKAPLKRTNAKGVPGEWQEISWDEAIRIVGGHIGDAWRNDKRLYIWQKGRTKSGVFHEGFQFGGFGIVNFLSHWAQCSTAGYVAGSFALGAGGGHNPVDYSHCKYLILWGHNLTEAGGSHLCWITWPQQFLEARERGMKVVSIDPRRRAAGPHCDEWIPIKPQTDLAMMLAMINVLIREGYIDEPFLKKHTNAASLVKADGYLYKVGGKEQVWDTATNSAKDFDAAGVTPALAAPSGSAYKTAFQKLTEHVAQYTPSWAEGKTGVAAATIDRIAKEFGQNALIGSEIVIDGKKLPYRPVAVSIYNATQKELGFLTQLTLRTMEMLVGAIDVAGSAFLWGKPSIGDIEGTDGIADGLTAVPEKIHLGGSKYYAIGHGAESSAVAVQVMLNPAKYGLPYRPEDMVMLTHMTNILHIQPVDDAIRAWSKLKFVACLDPFMTDGVDLCADIVLPTCTIEKYEGPNGVGTQYESATTIRQPVIPPLYNTKPDAEIYLLLAEEAGFLNDYLDNINGGLGLTGTANELPHNVRPELKDIFERWAKQNIDPSGLDYFKEHGLHPYLKEEQKTPVDKVYSVLSDPPYNGVRFRIYFEAMLKIQDKMKALGSDVQYYRDWNPLPEWRAPTIEQSAGLGYDLYLITYKKIEHKQSRSAWNSLLHEIEPKNPLQINPVTARARGISDGDEVLVTSHHPLKNETQTLKIQAQYVEGIEPGTVAIAHHHGHMMPHHPVIQDEPGWTSNRLFFGGDGFAGIDSSHSWLVRVKVTKA